MSRRALLEQWWGDVLPIGALKRERTSGGDDNNPNKQATEHLTCMYDRAVNAGSCEAAAPDSAVYSGVRGRKMCEWQCERPLREAKKLGLYTHERPVPPQNPCRRPDGKEAEDGLVYIGLDDQEQSRLSIVLPNGQPPLCTTPSNLLQSLSSQPTYAIWSRSERYERFSDEERNNSGYGYSVLQPIIILRVLNTGSGMFYFIYDDEARGILEYLENAANDPRIPTTPLALVRTTIPGLQGEDGEVGRYRYGNVHGFRGSGDKHAQAPGEVVYLLRSAYAVPKLPIPPNTSFRELVQETLKMSGMVHPTYGYIGDWDTSRVTDMSGAFKRSTLKDVERLDWDTSSVTDMSSMFADSNDVYVEIGGWTFPEVTNMSGVFEGATSFNGDVSQWKFPKVTSMNNMFAGATSFDGDVSGWKFPKVTVMSNMFGDATSFNGDVSRWTFPKVTSMRGMFGGATKFDGDVSKWTFPKVTNMGHMFMGATSFNRDVSQWKFPEVTNMSQMFEGATSFNGNVSQWKFPKVTYMSRMFAGASSFNGDVSRWTFPKVTSMYMMFRGATSFEGDVSEWTFPMMTHNPVYS